MTCNEQTATGLGYRRGVVGGKGQAGRTVKGLRDSRVEGGVKKRLNQPARS